MIARPEGSNIVVVGSWNRAIFSPPWMGEVVFGSPDVEVLIALAPDMPLVYKSDKVLVEVSSSRLLFRPVVLNDECLVASEQLALKILRRLPETPVRAVGINFAYEDKNAPTDVLQLFSLSDDRQLLDANWIICERKITRSLDKNGEKLNLSLAYDGNTTLFDFNYHTELGTNAAAQEAIDQRTLRLRDESIRILDLTYHLRLKDGTLND
jgi:hypothetical protein